MAVGRFGHARQQPIARMISEREPTWQEVTTSTFLDRSTHIMASTSATGQWFTTLARPSRRSRPSSRRQAWTSSRAARRSASGITGTGMIPNARSPGPCPDSANERTGLPATTASTSQRGAPPVVTRAPRLIAPYQSRPRGRQLWPPWARRSPCRPRDRSPGSPGPGS